MKDGWKYDIFGTITDYENELTRQIHLTAFDAIHVSVIHETVKAICKEFGFDCNLTDMKTPIIIDDESEEEE